MGTSKDGLCGICPAGCWVRTHFEGERLPKEHPLLTMTNAVLTPHIGGATYDTEANHSRMIAEDLQSLLSGKRPRYIANPEVL